MNPGVKGYFRLSNSEFCLIREFTITTELGLRNRRTVAFKVWVWGNSKYEGEPQLLTRGGVSEWFIELDERITTASAVEQTCINALLTNKALTTRPTRKVFRNGEYVTMKSDSLPPIQLRVFGKTMVEGYTREVKDHILRANSVRLSYDVNHTLNGYEEIYSGTLSYAGNTTAELPSVTPSVSLNKRIAKSFLYTHSGIVTH